MQLPRDVCLLYHCSQLLTFAIVTFAIVDVSIHHGRTTEYIHAFKYIFLLYRMRYDDWKSNSCRIIQLYHVFLRNTGDILVIFWYRLVEYRRNTEKIPKNCSNIHWYFIKTYGITGKYYIGWVCSTMWKGS